MAKTNTEKIDELSNAVAILFVRVDNVRGEIADLSELRTKVALLEHQVNRLVKTADDTSQWRRSYLEKAVLLLLGGAITLVISFLVKHFSP